MKNQDFNKLLENHPFAKFFNINKILFWTKLSCQKLA
jgi:hypothetical protein